MNGANLSSWMVVARRLRRSNGFAVGKGGGDGDADIDASDAESLCVRERRLATLYDRDSGGLPRKWID